MGEKIVGDGKLLLFHYTLSIQERMKILVKVLRGLCIDLLKLELFRSPNRCISPNFLLGFAIVTRNTPINI